MDVLFLLLMLCSTRFVFGSVFTEFIYPNFTASNLKFVEGSGSFLFSRNGTFKLAIFNPSGQNTNFYLCVIHAQSNTIIWSANRDTPVSNSGEMMLTQQGIVVSDSSGNPKWLTPPLVSKVSALQLTEMGNVVLIDGSNATLWDSFSHPTDTIVIGQNLPVGVVLSSSGSGTDLSTGEYRLQVTPSDMILQWNNQTYWKLSMDTKAYRNQNYDIQYMSMNGTGLFLFGQNGSAVVIKVGFSASKFFVAQLAPSGQFVVTSYNSGSATGSQELAGPDDKCRIPFVCGTIGVCTDTASNSPSCSCPSGFRSGSHSLNSCVPSDGSSLPTPCNSTYNVTVANFSSVEYVRLGNSMDYFAANFYQPVKYGVNVSACHAFCTSHCSCLGVFYDNSSGSCYAVTDVMGSIVSSSSGDLMGYIKTIVRPGSNTNTGVGDQRPRFSVIAMVLLPFTGIFLAVGLGFLWWRRMRISKKGGGAKLGSPSSGDLDSFYIPGLPQRYGYEELRLATDDFKTLIGSGGFGSVYKGTLKDRSIVAVKRITNLGVQGKKDFCTEIAVIGNIHHVNLVKLRGFCAQGRQRLLVYEYMNRGSLDKSLFGSGPALEWQERFDIALGTARGLVYLHTGCEKKIIHCDVKPENILLQDYFQAKLSDFGLSKLLNTEQSSLFTTMRGTRGYLAPEWLTSSAISEKTDVYSYGMVLLELVSGRKNCATRSQSHSSSGGGRESTTSSSGSRPVYFPLLALDMHEQGRYTELADPRLEGRVTNEEVKTMVVIALCCVHEDPGLRPSMVNVVGMLEGTVPLCRPKMESLNFLRFYGERFVEASMIAENERSSSMLYPEANTSATTTTMDSHGRFSFMSSQQISGPR